MKRIFTTLLLGLLLWPAAGFLHADEGLWLPLLIEKKIVDMQQLGFQLTAEDIYSVNQACLKDAIVHFGGGCTGELISNQGLLITNHHCGYSQIQAHSSVAHDYLRDGFWAKDLSEELPNPGLTVTFLRRMEDVTTAILKGVTSQMSEAERNELIGQNTKNVIANATQGTHFSAQVASMYYGNQYYLFVNEVFSDVRLVGAPPSSIGKFGGDTDNWMWPRHTGDFSIFRVYANKDNQPAAYSPDNVPYVPRKCLTISLAGVKEGDFTMVYGYPGRTYEYVLSPAIEYVAHVADPAKIHLRTLRLDIMNKYQAQDQAVRIQYSGKNATVSNAWKKWQGEKGGLMRLGTVAKKQELEARFQRWANAQPAHPEYAPLLSQMKALYEKLAPYQWAQDIYTESVLTIELLRFAGSLNATFTRQPKEGTPYRPIETARQQAQSFFKDYYQPIDKETFVALFTEFYKLVPEDFRPNASGAYGPLNTPPLPIEVWADSLFSRSALATSERTAALLERPQEEIAAVLASDPAVRLYSAFIEKYNQTILPVVRQINEELTLYYRTYMKALMEFDTQRVFFPDANSTLRVSYGTVAGYRPSDGVNYLPVSTLEGIMEKDNPQIFDYNIPQTLRRVYAGKDYGQWEENGSIPVCFLAANHTSGGNSGSPVLNAKGELLGLNFDRVWEGTMSDYEFDPLICRNISVDIRYVLFVIEKIGGANYLFNEMVFSK